MRFFIRLAYKGTNYYGWQLQPNVLTVQEVLENALSVFFRQKVKVTGAGRTDTGVHAKEYFAHFDLNDGEFFSDFNVNKIIYAVNGILPVDIRAYNLYTVIDSAHARFDALSRTYCYYLNTKPDPFINDITWFYPVYLNIDAMNTAAEFLTKINDFAAFSKKGSDNVNNLCNVTYAKWEIKENLLIFKITSDRFLRNMVRAIVGTLIDVGRSYITLNEFIKITESNCRSNAGASVPAKGLFLENIYYPDDIFLK